MSISPVSQDAESLRRHCEELHNMINEKDRQIQSLTSTIFRLNNYTTIAQNMTERAQETCINTQHFSRQIVDERNDSILRHHETIEKFNKYMNDHKRAIVVYEIITLPYTAVHFISQEIMKFIKDLSKAISMIGKAITQGHW